MYHYLVYCWYQFMKMLLRRDYPQLTYRRLGNFRCKNIFVVVLINENFTHESYFTTISAELRLKAPKNIMDSKFHTCMSTCVLVKVDAEPWF